MAEYVWIGREYAYVWIYNHRQGFKYISNNIQLEVTVQVNEYLLREYLSRRIQNPIKELR